MTCLSCSVIPSLPSKISKTISLLSIAFNALIAEYLSMASKIFPRFFKPAVSITVYLCPFLSKGVSIESLVVPEISLTITLS